jgi:hypothetical protein
MRVIGGWFTEVENLFSFYGRLSPKIACIWLSVWTIRRKAEADYALDWFSRVLRWSVVVIGFVLGYVAPVRYLRVASGVVGLIFLCWPNCAYYTANLFRRGSPGQDFSESGHDSE